MNSGSPPPRRRPPFFGGLALWLTIVCVVAAAWPSWFGSETLDPFLATRSSLGVIVALTMFSVGAVLPAEQLRSVLRRWPKILGGTVVQYVSMPSLAWLLTRLLPLEPNLKTGVLLVGCVPGAMASNVLTLVARGNVSYSVGLTTAATLASPLVVPFALHLTLGANADAGFLWKAALLLVLQVVTPTLLGFGASQVWPRFAHIARRVAGPLANACIVWIIAVVIASNRGRLPDLTGVLATALILLNLGGYAAGWLGGTVLRLPQGMRRALVLEVGMQNAGVGASLATALFADQPVVALPCGLFAFGCVITGAALAQAMARTPPDDEEPSAPDRVHAAASPMTASSFASRATPSDNAPVHAASPDPAAGAEIRSTATNSSTTFPL